MEKLCILRNIYRSIRNFEISFQEKYDLCLNEGMLLCSLRLKEKLSSSDIAEVLGLTTSNASKVIKSVEKKILIERILGKEDKRQMYFKLTASGEDKLKEIKNEDTEIDNFLLEINSRSFVEKKEKAR